MLGNWSFGDYFKREAIHWAWDFLTRDLGHPRRPAGGHDLHGRRRRAARSGATRSACRPSGWRAGATSTDGDDNNFWRMADTGPCGPCSEIHFDRGAHLSEGPECVPDHSEHCPRWLEIWNLVFMEFDQRPDGRVPLPFTERRHGDGPRARSRASSSRSRPTTTRTCSRRSTPGCASCSATTRRRSRPSASATRSSPTTRGR